MIDHIRRNILATGAAATAVAAAPQVFAQQAGQGTTKFYEKGPVRIAYQEVGSGFPLLATPGGGLNSKMSNWANAVINVMAEFKHDFRCITMDQRNATGGESTKAVVMPLAVPPAARSTLPLGPQHIDLCRDTSPILNTGAPRRAALVRKPTRS